MDGESLGTVRIGNKPNRGGRGRSRAGPRENLGGDGRVEACEGEDGRPVGAEGGRTAESGQGPDGRWNSSTAMIALSPLTLAAIRRKSIRDPAGPGGGAGRRR